MRKVEGRQESSFGGGGGQLSRQDGGSIIVEKSARQRRREHLRCRKEYQLSTSVVALQYLASYPTPKALRVPCTQQPESVKLDIFRVLTTVYKVIKTQKFASIVLPKGAIVQ